MSRTDERGRRASPADDTADDLVTRFAEAQALLAAVSREMAPTLDLQATLANVVTAMRRLVDFRGGSICLVQDGYVTIAAAHPAVSPEVAAARVPLGTGLSGRIASTGEPMYSPDLDNDERVDPVLRRLGSNAGMTSYLGVPLVCLGEVIGLLQVDSPEVDAFDQVDRMLLEGLAAHMASAIASARQFDEQVRLDQLKQQFIQLVSHELRTPLAIGSGLLDVVRASGSSMTPEQVDEALDRASVALARLDSLIEELLVMSRLAAGTLRPNVTEVAVRPLLVRVQRRSPDPAVTTVDCDARLHVRTDPELLQRALTALVENAVRYGGDCTLAAAPGRIVVRDHGGGIDDAVSGALFDAFARGDDPGAAPAGLGLGLTLARALVAELGGELTLTSSEDGDSGTVAEITLH